MLLLEGMEASYVDLADETHLEFAYVRRFRDVIDTTVPMRASLTALHVGGGACSLARYLAATRREARSEVYEYDELVADVARRQLALHTGPRLRLRVGDARELIGRRPDGSADVVVGDAFVDGLVPAHLATVEFARDLARVLRPQGFYLLNVIDAAPQRISRRVAATLLEVFPQLSLVAPHRVLAGRSVGNLVFVASRLPLSLDRVRVGAARDGEPTDVLPRGEVAWYAAGARPLADAVP